MHSQSQIHIHVHTQFTKHTCTQYRHKTHIVAIPEQAPIEGSKTSRRKKRDKNKSKKSGERSLNEETEQPVGAEVCKPWGVM